MMRKIWLAVAAASSLVVLLGVPAFAGSELPPPDDPEVAALVVKPAGQGEIAFTGSNLQVWMLVAAGLLVVGVALLIVGRRRRANATR